MSEQYRAWWCRIGWHTWRYRMWTGGALIRERRCKHCGQAWELKCHRTSDAGREEIPVVWRWYPGAPTNVAGAREVEWTWPELRPQDRWG